MDTSSSPEQMPERPPAIAETEVVEHREKFFPSGAIAFFIVLVILCLVIWFGVYFLMLERI